MIYTCEKMTKLTIFLCVLFLSVYWTEQSHFLSKEHIKQINDAAKTWKAKQNFPLNTPKEKIVRLLGSIIPKGVTKGPVKDNDPLYINYDEIPETFDARIEWQYCTTIGQVRNQGNCGSCWAHGTTGAFADRLCIATDGEFNQLISAEELTFCCHRCGFGCHGGYPIKGWEYFRRHGVVTGGNYNTTDGCAPYKIPPCLNDDKGNNTCDGKPQESHHRCPRTCYGNTTIDYRRDHHKTKDAYYLTNSTIQNEVIIYGPIEASFDVYDDFPNYESGVYMKTENASLLGSHSVKLIGWGVENDTPYWLMVNSWGEQWGDQGMFKIRRGTNECGIENSATAGIPLV